VSFAPGDLIGGRYELGRQLGAGGMARVYLGHDRLLDRQVAVKVLSEPYASDPQFVERFRREASAAAGLNHPNIVAVYDRGEADGSYYIVMEYLAGPDLKQVIRGRAPLPPAEAIDYAQQILAALRAAHRRDVIHRDVKPQNVLVAEDGHLKVTDFGIARAGAQSDMTEAGSVIGTAQYLSPEQARGDEVTAASDCYSVGIVLYEMLTGQVPFDGERAVAVAMKQIGDAPPPPRSIEPGIPPALEAVVLRALAKRPSERYRTVEELSAALAAVSEEIGNGVATRVLPPVEPVTGPTRVMEPVTGPTRTAPPPPPPVPSSPPRRRRWPWIAGAVVLIALIVVGAFALLSGDDAKSVTIPRVAGLPAQDAERQLQDLKLEVTRQTVQNAAVQQGLVVRTDPAAGAVVKEGDTVTLVVSGGPGQATVPNVEGLRQEDAQAALVREGFKVTVRQEASQDVDEGVVIRQEPGANTRADRNSTVTITVSTGPEQVTVPDLQQKSLDEAERLLQQNDLVVGSITQQPNSSFAEGTVLRQSPGPTAKVDAGTRVDLTVAAAPANVQVPNVIGNTADAAQQKLEALGFTVTSDEAESNAPAGNVIAQNPNPGTQVAPGSTINITVSLGPGVTSGSLGGGAGPGNGGADSQAVSGGGPGEDQSPSTGHGRGG
jgi:serine/threonine-protein kinase